MPVDRVADLMQASLAFQRARIEAAAARVAAANVPLSATSEAAVPSDAPANADFAAALGLPAAPAGADVRAPAVRLALEPGNPAADANGVVRYPAVDLAAEMTTMMSANRAYEASVRAYNLLKGMSAKAMEIGK